MSLTIPIVAADGAQSSVTLPDPTVGSAYPDGSANAPTGTPQFPSILKGYAKRAPWKVAGVDYRVGINTGVVLKPASLPSSGSPRVSGPNVIMDMAGSVLDGYDLSGRQLQVSAANCVVQNCKFQLMSSGGRSMTNFLGGCTNTTVRYCEFYGNYFVDDFSGSHIYFNGYGPFNFYYNYMERTSADFFDFYGSLSHIVGPLDFRFNVLTKSAQGGHPDWLAQGNGETYVGKTINFNLFFNIGLRTDVAGPWGAAGTMPAQGTQGIGTTVGSPGTDTGPIVVQNNTIIALPGASMNHLLGVSDSGSTGGSFSMSVNNNFVDARGSNSWIIGTPSSPYSYSGNINMNTGASI